ncbi:hypothetical protein E4U32_001670 [Claviceps aff. humidiphila group G2b]|nr:hypothetical protein E4U32_001670 [Claviceps aff. humidiphila group G2b]
MASNTRSSARASVNPESQTNPAPGGQSQAGDPPSDPATPTRDAAMEALQRQLAMERLQEEISQSQARRRAYDRDETVWKRGGSRDGHTVEPPNTE